MSSTSSQKSQPLDRGARRGADPRSGDAARTCSRRRQEGQQARQAEARRLEPRLAAGDGRGRNVLRGQRDGREPGQGHGDGRQGHRSSLANGSSRADIGSAPLSKIKGGKEKAFSLTAQVPATLSSPADDPFTLQACVLKSGTKGRKRCKSADGKVAVTAPVTPPPPARPSRPGTRTLNDPYFPQIGNGGYDAQHYRIAIDYDPSTNTFNEGTSTTVDDQGDAEPLGVLARLPAGPAVSRGDDRRHPGGLLPAGRRDAGVRRRHPRRHPAREARRHPGERDHRRLDGRRQGLLRGTSRRRSPTPTSPSRAGSAPAACRASRLPATAPTRSTSRSASRAGSRPTTSRRTRRRSRPSPRSRPRTSRSAPVSSRAGSPTATAPGPGTGTRTT